MQTIPPDFSWLTSLLFYIFLSVVDRLRISLSIYSSISVDSIRWRIISYRTITVTPLQSRSSYPQMNRPTTKNSQRIWKHGGPDVLRWGRMGTIRRCLWQLVASVSWYRRQETDDPSEAWKERLNLLDESQKTEVERLVVRKLDEMEDRVLAWDPDEYAEAFWQVLMKRREEQAKDDKKSHRKPVDGPPK